MEKDRVEIKKPEEESSKDFLKRNERKNELARLEKEKNNLDEEDLEMIIEWNKLGLT